MKRILYAASVIAMAAVVGSAKPKVKDSVTYAPSWKAAVQEAKMLNLPLVVHCHGFR